MYEGLAFLVLSPALEMPGCPICRIRTDREKRYIENLLLDHVTDGGMQESLLVSLGYCPYHTWEAGLLELSAYSDAVKNSMMYEFLIKLTIDKLNEYKAYEEPTSKGLRAWLHRILMINKPVTVKQDPFFQAKSKKCDVCSAGEDVERFYLNALLEGLGDDFIQRRNQYRVCDGLCFQHFRLALVMANEPKFYAAADFLVDVTIQKLRSLKNDLTGYIDKHAWQHHLGPKTSGEEESWLRAMRFFGQNETYRFLEEQRISGTGLDDNALYRFMGILNRRSITK